MLKSFLKSKKWLSWQFDRVLFTFYPESKKKMGFPGYYLKCTPRELKTVAGDYNFSILEEYYYYNSIYFRFFFPFHLLWRFWIMLFYMLSKEQAAETFTLVLKKRR